MKIVDVIGEKVYHDGERIISQVLEVYISHSPFSASFFAVWN